MRKKTVSLLHPVVSRECFDKICRVCLGESKVLRAIEDVRCVEVCEKEEEDLPLLQGFKKYLGYEIKQDDGKPHKICKSCIVQARKSIVFSQKLHQSDEFLKNLLLKEEVEPKEENEELKVEITQEGIENNHQIEKVTKEEIKYASSEDDLRNDNDDDLPDDDSDENFVPDQECNTEKEEKLFNPRLKRVRVRKVRTQFRDGEQFICIVCGLKTTEINEIIDHYEESHPNESKCIICEKKIVKKQLIRYHMSVHSKLAEQCKPCRQYFRSKELKDEHMKNYDHSNPLVCHICNKKFALKSRRDKHMIAHFGEKKFQCSECGARFLYQTSYERHYRKHFGKDFLCYICGKAFTTNFNVKQHIAREHYGEKRQKTPGEPKRRAYKKRISLMGEVECEYCGDILPSKPSYIRHRQNHPEFMDYPCRYCKAQFTAKEDLKHHVETQHKRYVCTYCGKGFPFKCQLDVHHVNHRDLNLTKLSCSICGLPRRNQKDLNTHMLGHTGEKPCVCEICGKTFRQQAHLNVHMYQHTGKKPHKCDVCGKTFTFRCNLVSHIRVHTGEKPYSCPYCEKAFRDSTILHKHKKKTHPVQLEKERNNSIPGVPPLTS